MRVSTKILAALIAAAATPSFAQFGDSYNFLKAVRDRDGAKATEIVSKPGSVIIDTRDTSNGEGAVHIVTRGRDLTWLNFLLSRGARVDLKDGEGNTPLMIAAQLGFVEGAQALIARRANVNLTNSAGETPIIRAVQNRDAAMVRLLMTAGANAKKADSQAGLSARDYAARDTRASAILKIIDETRPSKAGAAVAGPK